MSPKALLCIALIILLCNGKNSAGILTFTVRDSIEMTRFARLNPKVEFSPDKRFFAIVTSQGILATNVVESTLWVFSTAAVQSYLRGGKHPQPRIVTKIMIEPHRNYADSYEPVISTIQWISNSREILFQGQDATGNYRLYLADSISGRVRTLTPPGYDVRRFGSTPYVIVDEMTSPGVLPPLGGRINADAADVTGMSLSSILFPLPGNGKSHNFWIMRDGKNSKIISRESSSTAGVSDNPYTDVLVVAPNGRAIVVLSPATTIPLSWSAFEPEVPTLRIRSQGSEMTRGLTEYALLNVVNGKITSLIQAPTGEALGLGGSGANWSPSGKKVLLMNTFLPREGVNTVERARRIQVCFAAIVDIPSKAVNCLRYRVDWFGKSEKTERIWLQDGSFENNEREIVLRILHLPSNVQTDDRYRYERGTWRRVSSLQYHSQVFRTLSIFVKQDLNVPPSLWVTDLHTHVSKKLWDPNPQLSSMNLGNASLLHWKDVSGYEWTAELVKPPDYIPGKRYPLVIQTHGSEAEENEFLSDGAYTTAFAARPLASVGMIVLQMPIGQPEDILSPREAPDQIRGFESAIARLSADGLIDPRRVGIIGFSRTCWYVEGALIKDPQLFAAASITDGVDMSYMQYLLFGENENELRDEEEHIYGTSPFGKGLATWTARAPGFHLDRIRTPLVIGVITPGSLLGGWEMYASLRMQKKPVDLIYIPDGQHILQKPLDRMASQQGNVDWFRFWLQGYKDPDPAKAARYKRWEALRTATGKAR